MILRGKQLLDAITYLPCFRTRQAEMKGYIQLSQSAKDSLHPLVSVGKFGRVGQVGRVLEAVSTKVGACFVDLNLLPDQSCDEIGMLISPDGHYGAWRDTVGKYENLIPVAVIGAIGAERAFIRQVLLIEEKYGAVVIRSRSPGNDISQMQAALAAVADVNNVLIVLDFGYIRGSLDPKLIMARNAINALRQTAPTARIAVISSSFPKSVAAYGDRKGVLEILERELHTQLGGNDVAIYGDHSAIYPEPFEPSISRWVPRIDYCTEFNWFYSRRREDDGGYISCAKEILALEDWDDSFADRCWGASVIREAAQKEEIPAGFGSPINWIAARINMHIERQLTVGLSLDDSDGPEYGPDDWEDFI